MPILSAAGERRRFIVMRGGSVLAIWWRILKVSRRNYCNHYNLPIYLRDLSSKLSEMPKAEESLCGNKKKYINKKISSPLHPFGRFVGASSKLSGREHGLITLVPAQWELIFYNCDGLHILYSPRLASMWCTNEWECWNVKIQFPRWIAFFHSHRSFVSSVEYMLKIR